MSSALTSPSMPWVGNKPMEAVMEVEHSRPSVLAFVALAIFLAGMALGQLEANRESGRSRVDWPAPVPHPRSLQP
jgi:hypothetical protein